MSRPRSCVAADERRRSAPRRLPPARADRPAARATRAPDPGRGSALRARAARVRARCRALRRARRVRLGTRAQRVGLPARPVQGEHEQLAEPLADRVLLGQPFGLDRDRRVAAALEVDRELGLERDEVQLLQALALGLRPRTRTRRRRAAGPATGRARRRGRRRRRRAGRAPGPRWRTRRCARTAPHRPVRARCRGRSPGGRVTRTVAGAPAVRFGSRTRRRFETYAWSVDVAAAGGSPCQSWSMSRSTETTRPGSSRSSARRARCLGAPRSTGPVRRPPRAGPSSENSSRSADKAPILA